MQGNSEDNELYYEKEKNPKEEQKKEYFVPELEEAYADDETRGMGYVTIHGLPLTC